MMKTRIAMLLILALLLCGCQSRPAETTAPAETTLPVVETTQPVAETTQSAPETTSPVPEEPVITGLKAGYYLISSVGKDGDVHFYGSLDAENGYLLLNSDGTGTMSFEGTEGALTWEEDQLYWQDQTLIGAVMTYYDSELDREDSMLVLYFMDPVVSVVFRPAPVAEETL